MTFSKTLAGGPLVFAAQRPAAVTTVNGVVFGVQTLSRSWYADQPGRTREMPRTVDWMEHVSDAQYGQ